MLFQMLRMEVGLLGVSDSMTNTWIGIGTSRQNIGRPDSRRQLRLKPVQCGLMVPASRCPATEPFDDAASTRNGLRNLSTRERFGNPGSERNRQPSLKLEFMLGDDTQ